MTYSPTALPDLDPQSTLDALAQAGISLAALARAADLSYGNVSRVLHGHQQPGRLTRARLVRALERLGIPSSALISEHREVTYAR